MLITIYLFHRRDEKSAQINAGLNIRRSPAIKLALLAWLIFLSYISYGENSYLFLLFYKILPEFSALRGWGRLSITLLPGLALMLSFALADFENRLIETKSLKEKFQLQEWIPTLLVFLAAYAYQFIALNRGLTDEYWEIYFVPRTAYLIQTVANVFGHDIQPNPTLLSHGFSLAFIFFNIAAVVLVLLAFRITRFKLNSKAHTVFFLLIGLFSAINLWFGGPWLWNNGFSPKEDRQMGNYQRMLTASFSTPRKNENSTLTLSSSFSVGSPPKWHFARYQDFYFGAESDQEARDRFLGVKDGSRFFFSSKIHYDHIRDFLNDSDRFSIEPIVHEYTGDSLIVEVEVPQTGYFSFIDNWDEDWHAEVDGKGAEFEKLFGTFKSIQIPAGQHEIKMAYCPIFFNWANPACESFQK